MKIIFTIMTLLSFLVNFGQSRSLVTTPVPLVQNPEYHVTDIANVTR